MSRIDYSKWDNIECSSSDDDDDDNDGGGPARVTRLDGPSQVTFGGGDGSNLQIQPSSLPPPMASHPPGDSSSTSTRRTFSGKKKALDQAQQRDQEEKQWTDKGGIAQVPCHVAGSVATTPATCRLYWSQTRYAVTLRLELVNQGEVEGTPTILSKNIRVNVEGILPFHERHMAVGTFKPKLQIYVTTTNANGQDNKIVLLEDEFPHPVHLPLEDEEGDAGGAASTPVDWTIERQVVTDTPYISITLFKGVPMEGMHIWWKRPLTSIPELENNVNDPGYTGTTISNKNSSNPTSNNNSGQAFAQAWEDAHRMFREKRKQESEE